MSKKNLLATGLVTMSMFAQNLAFAQTKTVARPPQYVMLAFDGSYTLSTWQYSRDFSKNQESKGTDTHFTFFLNPVYLATKEKGLKVYKAPGGKRGSAIGWGDDNADISKRVDQMNAAYQEGHEMGSHAVGHHDGSKFTDADWHSELSQFDYMLQNVFSINGLGKTAKGHTSLLFTNDIVGFRAPQLGLNQAMYRQLPKFGIKYDTSQADVETYWPKKNGNGTWNFPLGLIAEPGTARKWISMDYNFCVRDTARVKAEDSRAMTRTGVDQNGKTIKNNDSMCLKIISAEQKAKVKSNMMNLYRAYFNKNYYGNRAPLNIGHHFSPWMSGAYLETFYEFANEVCSKPEVKCVTYKEFMRFMDGKSSSEIAAYQAGQFEKMSRPKSAIAARSLDMSLSLVAEKETLKFSLSGRDSSMVGLKKFISLGDQTAKEFDGSVKLSDVRSSAKSGEDLLVRVAVKDRFGKEISTATFKVDKVGTAEETIGTENVENKWLEGHLSTAHDDDADFSKGH